MPARLQDIPEGDRPRERLLRQGPEALNDRELLAIIFLRNGPPGERALDQATALIAEYGGLSSFAPSQPRGLRSWPDDQASELRKAEAIVAVFRLGRLASRPPEQVVLRSSEDVAALATRELSGLVESGFWYS